jgi:hypothetical protein
MIKTSAKRMQNAMKVISMVSCYLSVFGVRKAKKEKKIQFFTPKTDNQ